MRKLTLLVLATLAASTLTSIADNTIGAGHGFSGEIRRDGTLWMVGDNSRGQLGTGHIGGFVTSPVQVMGIGASREIGVGDDSVAVLLADGSVECFGANTNGELGPNGAGDSATPVQVTGLPVIKHLVHGHDHVLALDASGHIWGWGGNSSGQLSSSVTGTSTATPTQIAGLSNVKDMTAGYLLSAALLADGQVATFGDNTNGGLGRSGPSSGVPTLVPNLHHVKAIAAYKQVLALTSEGHVATWGFGAGGALGTGSLSSTSTPTFIPDFAHIKSIAAMGENSGALDSFGVPWVWGGNGLSLALGVTGPVSAPTKVAGVYPGVTELAGASDHLLMYEPGLGTVVGGFNRSGQLGIGSTLPLVSSTYISLLSSSNAFNEIAAGNGTTYLLGRDGFVRDVGRNEVGQLCRGTTSTQEAQGVIPNLFQVVDIGAGDRFFEALLASGQIAGAGNNDYGQLGNGTTTDSSVPVTVPGLTGVVSKGVGADFTIVIKSDHTVLGWGRNNHHQISASGTSPISTPSLITGYSGTPISVSAGGAHWMLLTSSGLYCEGDNTHGQCGVGTFTDVTTPTLVTAITGTISIIAAGRDHSAVLSSSGFYTFGAGADGALANGGNTDQPTPVNLTTSTTPPPSTPIWIWAGNGTTFYEDAVPGLIYGSGRNTSSQLGIGTTTSTNSFGAPSFFGLQVACGMNHTVALYPSIITAAGDDTYGQLCDGGTTTSLYPEPTGFFIPGVDGILSLSAGSHHSLSVDEAGSIFGWGNGPAFGGSSGDVLVPTQLTTYPLPYFAQASAGNAYSLGLDATGNPWAVGANTYGQLGDGTTSAPASWEQSSTLIGILKTAAGGGTSYYLRDDGLLFGAGDGSLGQLGGTPQSSVPIQIPGLYHIIDFSPGGGFVHALRDDGKVFGLGAGTSGQLGGSANSSTPVQLPVSNAIALSSGDAHGAIITADGSGFTIGSNSAGQLGLGNLSALSSSTPTLVVSGAVNPAAGSNFTEFNLGSGIVMGAGADNANQLNDGLYTSNPTFSQIPNLGAIQDLTAGGAHSLATQVVTGLQEGWGDDSQGQLGDGQSSPPPPPIVTNFVATADGTSPTTAVEFSWTASTGALNYLIQYSTDGGSTWSVLSGVSGTATSYNATGLSPGTAYKFEIASVNTGGQSPYSTVKPTLTTGYVTPVTPTSVLAIAGIPGNGIPNTMTVSWTISGQTDATEYDIQEENADGSFSTIYTAAGNVNSATISGISSTASPTIRVVAANPAGMSASATTTLTSSIVARARYIPVYLGNPNFIATSIANNGIIVGLDWEDPWYYLQRWNSGTLSTLTASGTHVSVYNPSLVQWFNYGANNNGEVVGSIQQGAPFPSEDLFFNQALYWGATINDVTPEVQPTFTVTQGAPPIPNFTATSYLANNAITDSSVVYGEFFNGASAAYTNGSPYSPDYYAPGSTVSRVDSTGTNTLVYVLNYDGFAGTPGSGASSPLGSAPPFTYTGSGFTTTNSIPLYAGTGLLVLQQSVSGLNNGPYPTGGYVAYDTVANAAYPLSFKPLGLNNAGVVWGTNSATGVDCWWDKATQTEHDLPAGIAVRSINSRQFTNGAGIQPDFQIAGGYVYSMTRDGSGTPTGWSTNKVEQYGGAYAGATAINDNGVIVGGGYMMVPAGIQRDGADVTSTNNTVSIGQQINLTNVINPVVPSSTISYQWQIPGSTNNTAFIDFRPSDTNDNLVSIQPSDLTSAHCNFYWATPGYKTVSCSAVVYGQTNVMTATFNVVGPKGTLASETVPALSADAKYYADETPVPIPYLHLGNAKDYPGNTFTQNYAEPDGYTGGDFIWMQLVHHVFVNSLSPTQPPYMREYFLGMDLQFPYKYSSTETVNDSPGAPLFSGYTNMVYSFEAEMYLLWLPPINIDKTVPVPIAAVKWGFSGTATNSAAGSSATWIPQTVPITWTTNMPITNMPTWSQAIIPN